MTPVKCFKLMSDETRFNILMLLMAKDELCVCDLTDTLQLSQPMVSRHLSLLRTNGFLSYKKQGQWVYYRLHPQLTPWQKNILQVSYQAYQSELSPFILRMSQQQNCC